MSFFIISSLSTDNHLVFPVYKIFLTENINNLYKDSFEVFNYFINSKGIYIKIDNTSDINVIPMLLFNEIKTFYSDLYSNFYYFETYSIDNKYKELTISDYCDKLELPHFILEDRGIKIPINELFTLKEDRNKYTFLFLGKEDENSIIIGKDLIKTMDIEFKDNNYIIHNEDFIIKYEDN